MQIFLIWRFDGHLFCVCVCGRGSPYSLWSPHFRYLKRVRVVKIEELRVLQWSHGATWDKENEVGFESLIIHTMRTAEVPEHAADAHVKHRWMMMMSGWKRLLRSNTIYIHI